MRFLGFEIRRTKAANLSAVDSRGGWWPLVRESTTGAWQTNTTPVSIDTALTNPFVYACVTLIASDVAKLRIRLVELRAGIWTETENPAWSPVLRKPNRYQNRIRFVESWLISKLVWGNTYVLKERDGRGVVSALYVLDPTRVRVLTAPDGSVFYEIKRDVLAGITQDPVVVPAREIIHDIAVALYHPLVGISPLTAAGLAALQGNSIQSNSTQFFSNGSQPGGVLTAPGAISQETAARLKTYWETNYSGDNVGKIAILGDGLKYEPMAVKAVDAQLVEQFEQTAHVVCTAFHVPSYLIGVGDPPTYNNVEALHQQYYSQCLQTHIESLEMCLDEGLELPRTFGTELALEDLLRMDTATKMTTAQAGVSGAILTPNEARQRFDLPPLPGGDTAYLQQQYYSLEALNRRDTEPAAPPPTPEPALPPAEEAEPDEDRDTDEDRETRAIALWEQRTADWIH